jgi:hypothetical protein
MIIKVSMGKKEVSEAAKIIATKGGKATLKKHGKEHYKKWLSNAGAKRNSQSVLKNN